MQLQTRYIPDDAFWKALAEAPVVSDFEGGSLPPVQILTLCNYAHLAFQPFFAMRTWPQNYTFEVPMAPEAYTGISYFITPPSRRAKGLNRIFASFTYGPQSDKGILVEVGAIQLQLAAWGVQEIMVPGLMGTIAREPALYNLPTSPLVLKGFEDLVHIRLHDTVRRTGIEIVEEPNPDSTEEEPLPGLLFVDIYNEHMAAGRTNPNPKTALLGGFY